MYTSHSIRISWAGVMSEYFNALNGVKQGGVISPIFFVFILMICYSQFVSVWSWMLNAGNFAGAIDYADDIVLISPTPLGKRKLVFTCDSDEFDILLMLVIQSF